MKKSFRRKLSASLISLLLLSSLLPVLAYAATSIGFYYNAETGMLHGEIYTSDPDAVSIELFNESEAIEEQMIPETNSFYESYDDNNTRYYSVSYSAYVGEQQPTTIKLTENETTYDINLTTEGRYTYYYDPDVYLDAYRIQGQQFFNGLLKNRFLKSGQKLVSFTPERSGHNSIEILLPRSVTSIDTVYNPDTTLASDFLLTDTTISESVYASAINPSYYWIDGDGPQDDMGRLLLTFEQPLIEGHTYLLSLSDLSEGNEIKLPKAGHNYSVELRYGDVVSYLAEEYQKQLHFIDSKNVVDFKNVSISSGDTTLPSQTPEPNTEVPEVETPKPEENKQSISADSLSSGKEGQVTIPLTDGKEEVILPVNAATLLGDNKLQLEGKEITVDIPTSVLKELQGLLTADQLDGAQIAFSFNKVSDSSAPGLLKDAADKNNAGLKAAGDIYDFSLSVITKDGKAVSLSQFKEPITISFKVSGDVNKNLVGVYFISDEGNLEFVGGEVIDGEITVEIPHFSKYAVLEYDKIFADVAASHWAHNTIKALAAKHIIQGVSEDRFAPQENVTRAEFVAMIVKALDLKATGTTEFEDVSADAWYAEAVAAASQAGIVNGLDNTTFAPTAKITREQMATILVKTIELKAGKSLNAKAESTFIDRDEAAAWALKYIDVASEAGLVQGREGNQFAPKALLTRAESAQVVFSLLAGTK